MNVNANGLLIPLFSCVPIQWQVCIRALATDATVRLLWKDKSNSACSTITSRAHWKFMWHNAGIWQRSTQNATEAIHMWRYVNAWESMSDIWKNIFSKCSFVLHRCICCRTNRRMANARQKSKSTHWIRCSMKRSSITCRWTVSSREHFGWPYGIRICLVETISWAKWLSIYKGKYSTTHNHNGIHFKNE